jgi:hypothetical protein
MNNTDPQHIRAESGISSAADAPVCSRIDVAGAHYSDRMWLFVNDSCTHNFDNGWDAFKMTGSALSPQLFAREADGDYQINAVNDMNGMRLAFQAGEDTQYTLTFTHQNVESRYAGVYLVDSVANKTIDVTVSGTQYVFDATSTPSPVNRFRIVVRPKDSIGSDTSFKVKVFSFNGTIYIDNLWASSGQMMIYDVSGHLMKAMTFGANCITAYNSWLIPGVYIVRCSAGSEQVTNRILIR